MNPAPSIYSNILKIRMISNIITLLNKRDRLSRNSCQPMIKGGTFVTPYKREGAG